MTGFELKAVLAFVLLALGIAAPLPDVVGGLMLGLGASYAAMLFTVPNDRMTVWATLFTGLIVTVIAAIAHPHLPFGIGDLPLQLVMAGAGLSSRWLGGMVAEFGKGGMERARRLPSEFKLPGGKK